jgi:prepilin-type N-terminal cleavage/methylation domain-containing protein
MNKKGFSLLELLCALAITTPCLIALTFTAQKQIHLWITSKKQIESIKSTVKAQLTIDNVIETMDEHTLPVFPIIHKHSNIRYTDQHQNPIMQSSIKTRPNIESDALTYSKLDLASALIVKTGSITEMQACLRFKHTWEHNKSHSLLALYNDKIVELKVIRISLDNTEENLYGKCYRLYLSESRSMLTAPSINLNNKAPQLLIPILDLHTLYVDKHNQLRILSHVGNNNIENQPIVTNIEKIRFDKLMLMSNQIFCLKAIIYPKHGKSLVSVKCNILARSDLFNFALNRP